jgi:hypothetical protein
MAKQSCAPEMGLEIRSEVTVNSDARTCCEQLEAGQILYFPQTPLAINKSDREFLLSQQQADSSLHKNISYRPREDVLRGFAAKNPADVERLHGILRSYSQQATRLLANLLAPYASQWKLDFASFRPIEEQNRDLPLTRRNDLLHVDSFPTRPTHGSRILRFFTNINPTQPRVWLTSMRFPDIARNFARAAGLDNIANDEKSISRRVARQFAALRRAVGMRAPDFSAYDRFMLRFHDYLKGSDEFQHSSETIKLEFPPNSTWMAFTDSVPHAVLSGRFAMEQTYLIPESALLAPQRSPRRILESLCGRKLAA